MKRAVKTILAGAPGFKLFSDRSIKVEILGEGKARSSSPEPDQIPESPVLKIRVHWHYPLMIPLADQLLPKKSIFRIRGRPTLHLRSSWAMAMFESRPGDHNNADAPSI